MIRTLLRALPLVCVLASCTTTVAIRSTEPGRVFVGPTRHVVILDGQGRRSAREFVNLELIRRARSHGYFTVEDRSDEGFEVRVAGRRAYLEGGTFSVDSEAAGLRVDVLEWSGTRDREEVRVYDQDGVPYYTEVPVMVGQALIAVTMFDRDGHAFLAESEYEGRFVTEDMQMPREEVIEIAAAHAIQNFLDDVTPIEVVTHVRLDEDDEGQEAILSVAKSGSIAQAADDMRRYLDANPGNASAAYNLGVFLEAMGQFQEALDSYDLALQLGYKEMYASARAQCARRLAAADSLRS